MYCNLCNFFHCLQSIFPPGTSIGFLSMVKENCQCIMMIVKEMDCMNGSCYGPKTRNNATLAKAGTNFALTMD